MIVNKKEFFMGLTMAIGFFVVLSVMFMPVFSGKNAFEASDDLFNSIAKGSTYYFDELRDLNQAFSSTAYDLHLELSGEMATNAEKILSANGAMVSAVDNGLQVSGTLGPLVEAALVDADLMFYNKGQDVATKYGIEEKRALYTWWTTFKEMVKSFKARKEFKQAAHLDAIMAKGVEVGYNFYQIEPKKSSSNAGILTFSLVFYVVYTLWWGYAIFFLFEGVGLVMKAGHKKEV